MHVMLTTSHAYWTWRALPAGRRRAAAVLGAAAPDLPALALGTALALRGYGHRGLIGRVYRREPWRSVHRGGHSVLAPVAIAAAGLRRPALRELAAGWGAHLAVDLATHHDDAWPPLWPLSRWRWRSPVSYWQRDHHAQLWRTAEALALITAIAGDRQNARRLGGVLALLALLAPGWRRRIGYPRGAGRESS